MRFSGFIIVSGLVLAIFLFAAPRPAPGPQNRSSQVLDLTDTSRMNKHTDGRAETSIISPAALIPGTWDAAHIPAERLVAALVVMDWNGTSGQVSVADVAKWESQHGYVPQGAIVAVRRAGHAHTSSSDQFPLSADAALFLMDARCTRGFVIETPASFGSDRNLSRQIALHGNYVIEQSARLTAVPETGALIIVAPAKDRAAAETPVRVLVLVMT